MRVGDKSDGDCRVLGAGTENRRNSRKQMDLATEMEGVGKEKI